MATMILRLEIDPVTKKKNVIVKLDSDSDALPGEHEEQHKKLVELLIAGGKVTPEDLGTISITREGQGAAVTEKPNEAPAQREGVTNKG